MKRSILILLPLLLLLPWGKAHAQAKGEKFVGLNLAALPYRVLEVEGEYFFTRSISAAVGTGFCFDRASTTAAYITERTLGGFFDLGPRFYFFSGENWSSFFGIAYHFGRFRRNLEVSVPTYFGQFEEIDQEVQQRMGYSLNLGVQYRYKRWMLQPALKFTVIGGRGAPYGKSYWVPGVGRVGLRKHALTSNRHVGFLPQLKLKFAF